MKEIGNPENWPLHLLVRLAMGVRRSHRSRHRSGQRKWFVTYLSNLEVRLTNVIAEFRMVVFRPFKGEVMIGRIRSSTPAGINLRTDFFDDIFVPFEELPEGAE